MATPEFITTLRASAGQQLLWLPGVSAVVFNEQREVLLGRRVDTGGWAVLAGLPEPGEQPAEAAVREVLEETGVHCVVERVVSVDAQPPIVYPNGDHCQYMDITLRCRAVGGEARVNDDESLEVGWFPLTALPELSERSLARIRRAQDEGPAWFAAP
jgi:ADP-ribose pyrophosphatase YjhB (NUDIX family)